MLLFGGDPPFASRLRCVIMAVRAEVVVDVYDDDETVETPMVWVEMLRVTDSPERYRPSWGGRRALKVWRKVPAGPHRGWYFAPSGGAVLWEGEAEEVT